MGIQSENVFNVIPTELCYIITIRYFKKDIPKGCFL